MLVRLRIILFCVSIVISVNAAAQTAQRQPVAPNTVDPESSAPISAGEIQRLYDAFVLVQAQEALQLSDDQYGRFVTRLKSLQETRRRHQQARNQILQDLRRLSNASTAADETSVRERLSALKAEDERGALEVRRMAEALDEVLDVRQQARFRLFEERMEQRKLELLLRARQNARNPTRRGRIGSEH
jgi:hypothetical protein